MNQPTGTVYDIRLVESYRNAKKSEKSVILDTLTDAAGVARETVIRRISKIRGGIHEVAQASDLERSVATANHCDSKKRGRRFRYNYSEIIPVLHKISRVLNSPGPKALHAAIPTILEKARQFGEFQIPAAVESELRKISVSTLSRMIYGHRNLFRKRGICGTVAVRDTALKKKFPTIRFEGGATMPGYLQGDTVHHGGDSTAAQYLCTLTITVEHRVLPLCERKDEATGWTVIRILRNKRGRTVARELGRIFTELPFKVIRINTDSGSEFINQVTLAMYQNQLFKGQKIIATQSRPGRKNDNCYVEQRNDTHVRELVGYDRYQDSDLIPIFQYIYERADLLRNYFFPTQRLQSKVRIGAKIQKKYDLPKTPAERLLESTALNVEEKDQLRKRIQSLNPFELNRELEQKLSELFLLMKERGRAPSPSEQKEAA
jgi:hypothetical protein